jgi:hypothetical protein
MVRPIIRCCHEALPELKGRATVELVARKFCTVMQTSVKIAYHGLGMEISRTLRCHGTFGRGFRNGGLISETGD